MSLGCGWFKTEIGVPTQQQHSGSAFNEPGIGDGVGVGERSINIVLTLVLLLTSLALGHIVGKHVVVPASSCCVELELATSASAGSAVVAVAVKKI